MSSASAAILREWYREDFAKFGYDPDPHGAPSVGSAPGRPAPWNLLELETPPRRMGLPLVVDVYLDKTNATAVVINTRPEIWTHRDLCVRWTATCTSCATPAAPIPMGYAREFDSTADADGHAVLLIGRQHPSLASAVLTCFGCARASYPLPRHVHRVQARPMLMLTVPYVAWPRCRVVGVVPLVRAGTLQPCARQLPCATTAVRACDHSAPFEMVSITAQVASWQGTLWLSCATRLNTARWLWPHGQCSTDMQPYDLFITSLLTWKYKVGDRKARRLVRSALSVQRSPRNITATVERQAMCPCCMRHAAPRHRNRSPTRLAHSSRSLACSSQAAKVVSRVGSC